ncbi:hypothetical protein [Erwinia sp. LJJL01]|uniref:hypothetical protein n=1 Tax=Erwinia sp. LJJL01 TaxID=3391839 RepID=UPI00105EDBC7
MRDVACSLLIMFAISLFLRRFLVKEFKVILLSKVIFLSMLWLFSALLFMAVAVDYLLDMFLTTLGSVMLYFLIILLVVMVSALTAFFAIKGPIENTYLTFGFSGDVRLDINKNFIPPAMSSSERADFIRSFIGKISSLSRVTTKRLTIKSHLLQGYISKVMEDALKESGFSFTCCTYNIGLVESATLNLWYGGSTRYRLFSHKKHANGFKAHRTGHKFVININP